MQQGNNTPGIIHSNKSREDEEGEKEKEKEDEIYLCTHPLLHHVTNEG